jgi:hypothetical protein
MPDEALRADLGRMSTRLQHRIVMLELALNYTAERLAFLEADVKRLRTTTASPEANAETE